MKPSVFIDGDQGTTGLQIVERLQAHDGIRLLRLPAPRRKDPRWRADALGRADIAILCLPDDAAREAVAAAQGTQVRILDASSAHRTEAGWVYGFPEIGAGQSQRIATARRVSNPGCYPSGAIALLRPLVDAGLLPADYPLAIHAVSGYSGGGRERIAEYEAAARPAPALQVYGLALAHKHLPEIRAHARLARMPVFVPAYGNFRQGIVLTIALHRDLLAAQADGARIHACLDAHFAGAAHVRVTPPAVAATLGHLDAQALNGTDAMALSVFENPRSGQLLLTAVLDNLGKGAAGAAVQNLALMLADG